MKENESQKRNKMQKQIKYDKNDADMADMKKETAENDCDGVTEGIKICKGLTKAK